jgi:hypothetical protein
MPLAGTKNSTVLGNSVIYEKDGNVGIGTTSPKAKLDVNGDARANQIISDLATIKVALAVGGYGMLVTGKNSWYIGENLSALVSPTQKNVSILIPPCPGSWTAANVTIGGVAKTGYVWVCS